MTDADLEAIAARATAATNAPWRWSTFHPSHIFSPAQSMSIALVDDCRAEDREFLVHARQDIDALLAEVRRLREDVAEKDRRIAGALVEIDALMRRMGWRA